MFVTHYFTSMLGLRYLILYLFPLISIICLIMSLNFTKVKQHNIIPLGQIKQDLLKVQQQNWNTTDMHSLYTVYLSSDNEDICIQKNNTFLEKFEFQLSNGLQQLTNGSFILESFISFAKSNNSQYKKYCSEDQKNTYFHIYLKPETQNQVLTAQKFHNMVTDVHNNLKYETQASINLQIFSPNTNTKTTMDDLSGTLITPTIFFLAFMAIFLGLLFRAKPIFTVIIAVNTVDICLISFGLNYLVYKGFKNIYSSYSFYMLLAFIIAQQSIFAVKFYTVLTKHVIKIQHQCNKRLLLMEKQNNLKMQAHLMQQLQQGLSIPTTFEQTYTKEIQEIKYQTIIFSLFNTHQDIFIQLLYILVVVCGLFLFLFCSGIKQIALLGIMGLITEAVSFLINYYNTFVTIAVFSNFFFKNNDGLKPVFSRATCCQYLEEYVMQFNQQNKIGGNHEISDDNNLDDMIAKTQENQNLHIHIYNQKNQNVSQQDEKVEDVLFHEYSTKNNDTAPAKQETQGMQETIEKIAQSRCTQIGIVILTIVLIFVFAFTTIASDTGITTYITKNVKKQNNKNFPKFLKHFWGGQMHPIAMYFQADQNISTDLHLQILYSGLLKMVLDSNQMFQQNELHLVQEQIQCPFLFDGKLFKIEDQVRMAQIYKDYKNNQTNNSVTLDEIQESVKFDYLTKAQKINNTTFKCLIFANITLNGEYSDEIIPYLRGYQETFNYLFKDNRQNISVTTRIISYQAYLNDIQSTYSAYSPILFIVQIAYLYLISVVLSITAIGPLSLIFMQEATFWFSIFIYFLIYVFIKPDPRVGDPSPFIFIICYFFTSYATAEIFSFIFFKYKQTYLKCKDVQQALKSISGEVLGCISIFTIFVLTLWIFLLTDVIIVRQVGIVLFISSLLLCVLITPFSVTAFLALFGIIGLWPYKTQFPQNCKAKNKNESCTYSTKLNDAECLDEAQQIIQHDQKVNDEYM